MDPNNNQPLNTNPFGQPITPQQPPVVAPTPISVPPVQQPTVAPTPVVTSVAASAPETPKGGSKKIIALLVILLILALGMGVYILFAKNHINNVQKTPVSDTNTVVPATTIAPTTTPATVEEINVSSPEADLKGLEKDVQGL